MSALDPFALGGRQDADELVLAAFREWADAVRATGAAGKTLRDDEFEAALERDFEQALAITEMPVTSMMGLAVKMYLAIYARHGGNHGDEAALYRATWEAGYHVDYIESVLAEDLVRFVPELAPLLADARSAAREALYEPEEGDDERDPT
jgi:hypothetical protein